MEKSSTTAILIQLAKQGDQQALAELLEKYHSRLRKMVRLRLDRRLHGKVDTAEIVREATDDAARRIDEFQRSANLDFYLWLRLLTGQKLVAIHRHHLGHDQLERQEVSLYRGSLPEATSDALAAQLMGRMAEIPKAVQRAEMQLKIQAALNHLNVMNREVLVLRHFEHLSNAQTAAVLDIGEATASRRFIAAIKRFTEHLKTVPGCVIPGFGEDVDHKDRLQDAKQ